MRISIIGAGKMVVKPLQVFFPCQGYNVALYDINEEKISELKKLGGVRLEGRIIGFGKIRCITANLAEAVKGLLLLWLQPQQMPSQSCGQCSCPILS